MLLTLIDSFSAVLCQIDQQKVQQQGTAGNGKDGWIAEQARDGWAEQRAQDSAGSLEWLVIAEDAPKRLGWHFQRQNRLRSRH